LMRKLISEEIGALADRDHNRERHSLMSVGSQIPSRSNSRRYDRLASSLRPPRSVRPYPSGQVHQEPKRSGFALLGRISGRAAIGLGFAFVESVPHDLADPDQQDVVCVAFRDVSPGTIYAAYRQSPLRTKAAQ
jgi:hypothetical protein